MVLTKDIYNYIDNIAPFSSQMGFDNSGLLIGDDFAEVKKATLALDITSRVIKEAINNGSQLIISHHPIIFHPLKSINTNSVHYKLVKSGIHAICAHTNLDIAQGGVNDVLAEKIGLKNIQPICPEGDGFICRVGELENSVSSFELAKLISEALNFKGVTFSGYNDKIKTVAVCGGSGDNYLYNAFSAADAFVTGEVKHHNFLTAEELSKTIVSAGHYATEAPAMEKLKEILEKQFNSVEFILTNTENPQKSIIGG